MTTGNEIVDAEEAGDDDTALAELAGLVDHLPPLRIGPGLAVMGDGIEAIEQLPPDGKAGCAAIIRCEGEHQGQVCGQLIRLNLLTPATKSCKKCGRKFTHLLVVAEVDDDQIVGDVMLEVMAANGIPVPDLEDGDDE